MPTLSHVELEYFLLYLCGMYALPTTITTFCNLMRNYFMIPFLTFVSLEVSVSADLIPVDSTNLLLQDVMPTEKHMYSVNSIPTYLLYIFGPALYTL